MKEIYFDELTGCYNRRFLHEWIDTEIKRANRFATKFALILIDLDDFREINNTYGHPEGDRVLNGVVRVLKQNIREVDSLVRYGGDEFIVLVPNTDIQGVMDLAQRILANLNAQKIDDHDVHCSMGFSIFPDDGTTADLLVSKADNLMYQAKKKGKNQIGLRPEITRKLQLPSAATIGREDEINWCLDQLPGQHTLFVAGEAGIGKTRLVLEIKRRQPDGAVLFRGNCYAAMAAVPYHPFKNLFSELLHADRDIVQMTMRELPDAYRTEIDKFLPQASLAHPTDLELDKYRLFDAISRFLTIAANRNAPGKTIIFIDDLHWIDQASCELLDFLVRSLKDDSYLLGTYRVEEIRRSPIAELLGVWAREKLYAQILLPALNDQQTRHLLESLMGPGAVPESAAEFIFKQSGGNPFFMEEILRELERQNHLYWNGKEWVFVRDAAPTIPESIEETILRKLKFLPPEIRQCLQTCAVFGHEFGAEIIALASQRNPGEIMDAIDELVRLGLLKERSPDVYFFSEDIIRQIVYKNTPRSELLQHHRLVGQAIERMNRDSLPAYYEQLADHYTIANETSKALCYAKLAAAQCAANYAHAQAVRFYETALRFEDRLEEITKIKLDLARSYARLGDHQRAVNQLAACRKLCPLDHRPYYELADIYSACGDYRLALKNLRKGMSMVSRSETRYMYQSTSAWIHRELGQYEKARKICEDVLKHRGNANRRDLSLAHVTLGTIHAEMGDFGVARRHLEQGLVLRRESNDKAGTAACYIDLAVLSQRQLNIERAAKYYSEAVRLYEEIGSQSGLVIAYLDLGALHYHFDLKLAGDYFLKGLGIANRIGAKRSLCYLYTDLGHVNFRALMDSQALKNYRQALGYARETSFDEGVLFINLALSEFYRENRQRKMGRKALRTSQRLAAKLDLRHYVIDCQREEIEYLLVERAWSRADRGSRNLVAEAKKESDPVFRADMLISRAKVLVARKKYRAAHEMCAAAQALIRRLPPNLAAADIAYLRGVTYQRAGEPKKALSAFLEANDISKTVGDLRALDKIEREIAGTTK